MGLRLGLGQSKGGWCLQNRSDRIDKVTIPLTESSYFV